jgi:hypothetical protein
MNSNCLNVNNHQLSWHNLKLFFEEKVELYQRQFSSKRLFIITISHNKNDFLQD